MPGQARPVTDERDGLLVFLGQMRLVLKVSAYGLTDDQAREAAASPSTLTVGGLIKHSAAVERSWAAFRLGPDETLASVIADYDEAAADTDALVAGTADLDQPVPVPKGVPWFPQDLDAWSVRWVLLHLIQETARHAGHAYIVREAIDGATAFPLMAAVEEWAETPWMKPWQPAS
ncbi:MAG: DinB family protein [Actinobacteria bacterium]|nr:MAG: DinB family protein [Actinomycetota bacterium]